MSDFLQFFVPGQPAPKGSLRPITRGGRTVLIEQSKLSEPWKLKIRQAGHLAMRGQLMIPKHSPVGMTMVFVMPRPESVTEIERFYPTVTPDVDKLCRNVLDALTGVIYLDDCQVIDPRPIKIYEGPDTGPAGVHIRVHSVEHTFNAAMAVILGQ